MEEADILLAPLKLVFSISSVGCRGFCESSTVFLRLRKNIQLICFHTKKVGIHVDLENKSPPFFYCLAFTLIYDNRLWLICF